MKSPWKFLAQLTSRQRPAETRGRSIGRDADTEASESAAQQVRALPLSSGEGSHEYKHDENPSVVLTASNETEREVDAARVVSVPIDVKEVQAPPPHEAHRSSAEARALLVESKTSKKPRRIPRTKGPGRATRTRAEIVAQSDAVAKEKQSARSSSSREFFFDEVVGLDEEIGQLRVQLAQKLYLQNVQLKRMLERFGVS